MNIIWGQTFEWGRPSCHPLRTAPDNNWLTCFWTRCRPIQRMGHSSK